MKLALIALAASCAQSIPAGPVALVLNGAWLPLSAGDHWVMRNVKNGARTFFDVRAADPDTCGGPEFIVRMTKDSPDTYWGAGEARSIDWAVRVAEDGSVWSPGAWWYSTADASGPVVNTWLTPTNLAVPAGPVTLVLDGAYKIAGGYATSCDQFTVTTAPQPWRLNARLDAGGDLVVHVVEGDAEVLRCGGFGERWTFRRGLGLVRIEWASAADCSIGTTERL